LILPTPIRVEFGYPSHLLQLNRENLPELLDAEGPNRHSEALQQVVSVYLVWLLDFLQDTFVCFV
jgi:hypothetical protein